MSSRISLNIHGNNVPDEKRLLDHLAVLQPPALLVLDNLDLARRIKILMALKVIPTTVIFREFGSQGDGALHDHWEGAAWVDRHAHQAEGGIVLHVGNEPPFDDKYMTFLVEAMTRAVALRVPMIVGNWAVGNPGPDPAKEWPKAKEVLKLLDQHRDLFILGLHEYAGGVVTSGLYGGYPDNAGVQPGKPGGKNLIQPENWPKSVEGVTCYHMGRFKFLLDYCASIGLKPPRIILTEHGFDDTSDIKWWEDRLRQTHPYQNISGWRTLINQWREWFGGRGWTAERALFEQLKWADQTIYQNSPVEAQLIFCWGHSSDRWEKFDVAHAAEFHLLLEAYARTGLAVPPVKPPTPDAVPKPDDAGAGETVRIFCPKPIVQLRIAPDAAADSSGEVKYGQIVTHYPATLRGAAAWRWIETDAGKGWLGDDLGQIVFVPLPPTTPPVNGDPPVEKPDFILLTICTPQEIKRLSEIETRAAARAQEAANDAAERAAIFVKWLERLEFRLKDIQGELVS